MCSSVFVRRGDAATGLAQSAHRMQGAFEVGGQEHFYLEGQIAYALPLEQKQWWIYSSTQHPGEVQHWWRTRWASTTMRSGGVPPPGRRLWRQGNAAVPPVWLPWRQQAGTAGQLRLDGTTTSWSPGAAVCAGMTWALTTPAASRAWKLQMAANCGFSADLSRPWPTGPCSMPTTRIT